MKAKKIIIVVLCLALLTAFNYFNAVYINPTQLTIREENLKSDKIDASLDGLTIAYFSDLNYGSVIKEEELSKLVDTINTANPDIVLFGGDLLYSTSIDTDYVIEELTTIRSKIGKFCVLGESDDSLSEDILEQSGFEILDNENVQIYSSDNAYFNLIGLSINADASAALADISSGYSLCLSHYPDNATKLNNVDYILAGHSLGGQTYFPLISSFMTIDGATKYYHGKHNVNDATLDITNGIGTKEKSVRFLADAEVVFYKLTSK